MRTAAALAGVLVLAGATSSVLRTLVVPRGLASKLTALVAAATRLPFQLVARRLRSYEARDQLLAWAAPITLVGLLAGWFTTFLAGWTLLEYAAGSPTLDAAVREAGSSMLTLGFANTHDADHTALDFVAAATGPVVIALQIAYLPTLYAAYNRRETEVTLLQSRAGEPAWGLELLARHQLVDIVDSLPSLYAAWERWAADVGESHANYPVLIRFRSPQPYRSWVIGLLAVLDAAALHLALCPRTAPSEARLCLRMGFTALRDIARVERIPFDPDPRPDAPIDVSYDTFVVAVARLVETGFRVERGPEDAWPHFRGWRVNYESVAYELALRTEAVPALWSGPRRSGEPARPPRRPADRRPGA